MSIPDALAQRLRDLSPEQRELLLRKLRAEQAPATIPAGPRDGRPAPLSPAQQALWFLHQLDPASVAYHMPLAVRVTGLLDVAALRAALDQVADRHDILRTVFPVEDGAPVQVVVPGLALALVERTAPSLAEAAELARQEVRRPFDLARGPLLRGVVIRVADDDHVVQLAAHHIIVDGMSLELVMAALVAAYGGAPLPAPRLQYADYARWHRARLASDAGAAGLAHWKAQLAGAPPRLALPTDRPRPSVRVPASRALPIEIPAATWQALDALARACEATPFMALLAAYALTLGRAAGERDVVIGAPIAGRERAELRDVIGLFVNTLAWRVELGRAATFVELVHQVRATVLAGFGHADVPFDRVVEAVQPARDPSAPPIFQAMLVVQPVAPAAREVRTGRGALAIAPFEVDSGAADHDLVLSFAPDAAGGARGVLHYATALWDAPVMGALWQSLLHVLAQVTASPHRPLAALALASPAEQRAAIVERNATARDLGRFEPVHALIARQARATPDAIALRYEGDAWSYAALDDAAAGWASALVALGAGPDRVIAVCMDRGPELVLAVLATLRAGAAYLPLDPAWPAARITAALTDAGAIAGIDDGNPALAGVGLPRLALSRAQAWSPPAPRAAPVTVDGAQLAYVICTSGSTGRPKAVMATHEGLTNRLRWQHAVIGVGPGDRVLHKTPATFDVSVWELLWPLMYGATTVIARPGGHREPDYLRDVMQRDAVTIAHFVPSMFDAFLAQGGALELGALRAILCSGEALPAATVARAAARLPGTTVLNLYGPTEAAIDVTWWTCRAGEPVVPIGRPIANTRVYVLDDQLRPVPTGVAGDLYLAGIGLARGYASAAARTAERFVPDPFGAAGARMYRTGDRARWRGDASLEFLGRDDHQIKLRGHRIELGEIEAALAAHPGVRGAAVILAGDRLIGYAATEHASDELLRHLADRLPAAMVPSAIVTLPALPLTASGKLDRRALPAPETATPAAAIAPRTILERELAAIWAELTGGPPPSVGDDFFAAGGHSLLMMRLATRLGERLGTAVPLRLLFDAPTIEGISISACAVLAGRLAPGDPLLDDIEALDADTAARLLEEVR